MKPRHFSDNAVAPLQDEQHGRRFLSHPHTHNMITIPCVNWWPGFISAPRSLRKELGHECSKCKVFFNPQFIMHGCSILIQSLSWNINNLRSHVPVDAVTCQPLFFFFLVRTRNILDDFREAYYWLRQNTDEHARVMSWWDYGYQIAGMANRTTLVDNNTWNNSHIALVSLFISFVFVSLLSSFFFQRNK